MSSKYIRCRGMEDVYGEYALQMKHIEDLIYNVGVLNGYSEIRTPIVESTDLFTRSVGETSDIVKKEFYNFKDKGDREVALRPEGTAAVIRSVVEEKLLFSLPSPLKLMYHGPMFRYERPQSGRLRQFNQFGFEIINTESIYDDVDVLMLASQILDTIGIKNWTLEINNIGNMQSRENWVADLKKYFAPYKDQLTELSVERLESNPLRILDDKIDGVKDFVKNAPKISAYLTENELANQKILEDQLTTLGINFTKNESLVRGLDYYTNLVFEFNIEGSSAIIAGGRYAKLVSEISGDKDASSIGFALGIERIIKLIDMQKFTQSIDAVIATLSDDFNDFAVALLKELRYNKISAVCNFQIHKIAKCFSYAESLNANFVIIIGKEEYDSKIVTIKNQKNLKQEKISIDKIKEFINMNCK